MIILESRIKRIIRDEIILETMRRFPGKLVPGVWDPARGAGEEQEDLEKGYFGKDTDTLTSLALDLSHFTRKASILYGPDSALALKKIGKKYGSKITFLGRGAYRSTFSIGDDLAIKVANDLGAPADEMNRDDYRLGTDAEIGQIVPRAFIHGNNFDWVVLERVAEITDERELIRFFKSSFISNPESLTESQVWTYWNLVLHALYEDNSDKGYKTSSVNKLKLELSQKLPLFRNLQRAIKKYNISERELRPDNFGIGSDGRLVLLDSSIF